MRVLRERKQKRDLLYAANGQPIEFKETLTMAELPAALRQAVSKVYPRATLQKLNASCAVT